MSSLTDTQAAPYADNYFQYENKQVTLETVQGAGSSSSGGLGTYTFSYTPSGNTAGFNSWNMKTVVGNPDGSSDTVYTNAYGQVLLADHYDPTGGTYTNQFYLYNFNGQLVLTAEPSAISSFSDANFDLLNNSQGYADLNSNSGLIARYDYYAATTATETAAGGVAHYLQDEQIQQGWDNTLLPQETWQYYAHSYNGQIIAPLASDTVYRNTDGSGAQTTSYAYTWYTNSAQIQSETDTAPVISASENGPGTADVSTTYYDAYGNAQWTKDADGFIQYDAYDPLTGALLTDIVDVNTADNSEFTNLPSGWSTPSGGGLNLATTDQVDALGRTTKETSPNGNITYYVYLDPQHEERIYQGWNGATATLPTEVLRDDSSGTYSEDLTMTATPHTTNGAPDGSEAISGLQSLTRDYTNAAGQVTAEDAYYSLYGLTYSTGIMGTLNTNYYQTTYSYDNAGRLYQTTTPNGTLYQTVYNSLDEALSDSVGTSTSNLVVVSSYQYDSDGNLTQETDAPGLNAANRVTEYWYDWRDRLVAEKDGVESSETDGVNRPILVTTYDNLDEAIQTQQYLGDGVTPSIVNGVLQALDPTRLRAQEDDFYDEQGRVYQTQVFDVNPVNGSVSASVLTTNYYYDHRGDLIAESDPGGLWTKSSYDGAGRDGMDYTTDGGGGATWAAAASVANDTVLEQEQSLYDNDGNVIETIDRQRFHNTTGTGPLGTPTSSTEAARVYYAANYYDNVDRVIASVDAGTNGGTAWTRPSAVPSSSPTLLVTTDTYSYNAAGSALDVHDPMGIDTHYGYDNLGRLTKTIEDYTGQAETAQSDVSTNYYYDGNNNLTYVQANEPGGAYQETRYVYGVTTASGSGVNSNDILSAAQYPDPSTGKPSSSQEDKYLTNALADVVQYTDRNGTVHQYSYDVLGRLTSDNVTTLGAGVDGTVRQITSAYDSQGNLYLITSLDGSGNVLNQVQRQYNGLGQQTGEWQQHYGAVNTNNRPDIVYSYNEMANGQNNSRLLGIEDPDGYQVNYNYNSGLDSNISRLSSLSDSSGTLESYLYLGLDTVIARIRPQGQSATELTLVYRNGDSQANHDGGDQYTGLDRFGRVLDVTWINDSTGTQLDRYQYVYDPDSEVVARNNDNDPSLNEAYQYNNLGELTSFQRASNTVTWTPDALGNFTSITTNGTAQTRTANQQNEYTSIGGDSGVQYDANGNLKADGRGWTYNYDAWNRLISASYNGTVIAKYAYDGLNRQIQITENGATSDLYYSSSGQVLEEYGSGNTVVTAVDVWSPVYVNALVYREQGGVRYYALQDGNWNVTAWVNASGTVVERYAYDPYGMVTVLDANWNVKSGTSLGGIPYGFQGMRDDWWLGNLNLSQCDRVENPWMETWQQMDPLWEVTGPNGYVMEGNGPTYTVDPSGMAPPVRIVSPTVTNVWQWTQEVLLGRKPSPPQLIKPIVDVPGRARSIYEVSREGGEGKAGSAALAGLVIVSDTVGVTNLDEARRGRDILNNDLTLGERWFRGVMGTTQLAALGKGMYDYPTPGQLRILNPRIKVNGTKCLAPNNPSPRTPVGRAGQQHSFPNPNAPQPRNSPTTINGRQYSGHAIDRMQERGFTPSVIENTIQHGQIGPGSTPGTVVRYDPINNVSAVIDQATGRVVTVSSGDLR